MISNSGHDENGRYNSGAAGDQTGREWAVIPWYSRPWNVVLRYPSKEVAEKIVELSRQAAANDKIGYDQWQRTTYWTQLRNVGYYPKDIRTACEADCSAGVLANIKAVGHLLGIKKLEDVTENGYTATMKGILVGAGFQALTERKFLESDEWLLPGDVLLYEGHHTAVNLDKGKRAEWTDAYCRNVMEGQKWLNTRYGELQTETFGEKLVVDGEYGRKTRRAALAVWKDLMNRQFGTNLNPGNENFGAKCTDAAKDAIVMMGSQGTFVRICQLILAHNRCYAADMDGECGIKTCKAIKKYKKSKGMPAAKKAENASCGHKMWSRLFNE